MTVESATYISSLNASYPAGSDAKSEGDNHIRLLKSTIKATFPNVAGAMTADHTELNTLDGITASTAELNIMDGVTATAAELNTLDGITATVTELNYTDGVTSAIQTQINTKAAHAGQAYTGAHDFSGASGVTLPAATTVGTVSAAEILTLDGVTSGIQAQIDLKAPLASPALTGVPTAPTAAAGTSTTQIATTRFVQDVAMTAALPDQTGHDGKYLRTNGTSAYFDAVAAGMYPEAKSSGFTAGLLDEKKYYRCTGTFTVALDDAATLGEGWMLWVHNIGTGDITINPDASELIDGAATLLMYPNECRLIMCSGTAFYSIVLVPFSKTFDATGTFTKPPGYSTIGGLIWSGGNSGQRTNSASTLSCGGGAGGCFPFTIPASLVGATETVTVGAGGAAVTAVANGNVGGASSFGSFFSVSNHATFWRYGGSVTGLYNDAQSDGFVFAAPSSTTPISQIWAGGGASTDATANSGSSVYGGGGGGGVNASGTIRAPGTSAIAGNGGAASVSSNGTAGIAPAGGGGATQTGTASGAGADGRVMVWGLI